MGQGGLLCIFTLLLVTNTYGEELNFTRDTWCEHKGTYLTDYVSESKRYDYTGILGVTSILEVCLKLDDCGGVTYDPKSFRPYSIRHGEDPINGSSGQISWTRCTVKVTLEKLEVSTISVAMSNGPERDPSEQENYKILNTEKMVDGDVSTSGMVYAVPNVKTNDWYFSFNVNLTGRADIHGINIHYTRKNEDDSVLSFQGSSVWIDDHMNSCGDAPGRLTDPQPGQSPITVWCTLPKKGSQIGFDFGGTSHLYFEEDIHQYTLEVNELEVYGKILPEEPESASVGKTLETVLVVVGAMRLL